MNKKTITLNELQDDLAYLHNKKISRAWKGFGSALFLEIGNLHKELAWGEGGTPISSLTGEWTLSSDGAWKIQEAGKELLNAEHATPEEINKIIEHITNLTIQTIETHEKQLTIHLSNNFILIFMKADYGFFTLLSNEKPYISSDHNTFVHYASL